VYADFVVDLASNKPSVTDEDFRLIFSVDGLSNLKGSGTGVILEGPNGVLLEKSL